ncbi:MAG: DUF4920 domain-containing protein [Flavobacteriales bacterium]|nr:DUF4920 domain-containing protein [Flavobacteriales bacterium]
MKKPMILALATTLFAISSTLNAQKTYGEKISEEGAMSTAELLTKMEGKESMEAKVSCEIITSCVKKGCWMDVKLPNDEVMKVRFKDYGFFVPTKGLEGKTAVLEGLVEREVIDVATLQHYAEDAGKSKEEIAAITEPRASLTFTANGVIIRD